MNRDACRDTPDLSTQGYLTLPHHSLFRRYLGWTGVDYRMLLLDPHRGGFYDHSDLANGNRARTYG